MGRHALNHSGRVGTINQGDGDGVVAGSTAEQERLGFPFRGTSAARRPCTCQSFVQCDQQKSKMMQKEIRVV